ncbi:MAG: hypothetical protein WCG34_08960, partial [Leptolinea sp.]
TGCFSPGQACAFSIHTLKAASQRGVGDYKFSLPGTLFALTLSSVPPCPSQPLNIPLSAFSGDPADLAGSPHWVAT